MRCSNCNEHLEGDGYTQVLHCPNSDSSEIESTEPDAPAIYCKGDMTMGKDKWRRIQNNNVRHVWKRVCDADCDCDDAKTFRVSPDWYEANGTPQCGCGEDMTYSHTEVRVAEKESNNDL
jgi:hypothetical protein